MLNGDIAIDDRGKVSFVNDFDFKDVKRFYVVENHQKGFVRAWHGHKKEGKYVYVSKGAAIIAVVSMKEKSQQRYVLSAEKPQILFIPPENYNGFKTLTDDTQVFFFSTSTLEESKDDDFRLPAFRYQHLFEVTER